MKKLGLIVILILASKAACSLDKTKTGFCYPTGKSQIDVLGHGWFGARDTDGYRPIGVWHCGADIGGQLGDSVYAIADGTIVKISQGGWSDSDQNPDNFAYLILHNLKNNEKIIAVYGHLSRPATLENGTQVTTGQELGRLGKWSYGIHLHFGIYQNRDNPQSEDFPSSGYGRQKNPRPPVNAINGVSAYNDWLDPIAFIENAQPNNSQFQEKSQPESQPENPNPPTKPKKPSLGDKIKDFFNSLKDKVKLPDALNPGPGKAKAGKPLTGNAFKDCLHVITIREHVWAPNETKSFGCIGPVYSVYDLKDNNSYPSGQGPPNGYYSTPTVVDIIFIFSNPLPGKYKEINFYAHIYSDDHKVENDLYASFKLANTNNSWKSYWYIIRIQANHKGYYFVDADGGNGLASWVRTGFGVK